MGCGTINYFKATICLLFLIISLWRRLHRLPNLYWQFNWSRQWSFIVGSIGSWSTGAVWPGSTACRTASAHQMTSARSVWGPSRTCWAAAAACWFAPLPVQGAAARGMCVDTMYVPPPRRPTYVQANFTVTPTGHHSSWCLVSEHRPPGYMGRANRKLRIDEFDTWNKRKFRLM